MYHLRTGLPAFRRLHLRALVGDWHRTLLSVIGVALGVTIVLATLLLRTELSRPFDAFGPALTHAAQAGVLQVTANVDGRLPAGTVDRLRNEVPGAAAVVPVVAALTPVTAAGVDHGFFLLGGSCQIELLVGAFDCERRARQRPVDGPGVPLQIPTVIAERSGLHPGDELRIPGLPAGSAHLGSTFPDFERVEKINDGYVLMAPSAEVAAQLLAAPGYATTAFVVPKPGAQIRPAVDHVIAGIATAGPPRPHQPAIFENAAQTFNLTMFIGVLIGFLVAVNTVLLAVEDRRAVMGTLGAIGANPVTLFGGMLAEGAVVGVLGGLLGVPSGFTLGTYLVERFGQSMLAGSGGSITAHFTPNLILTGAAAGLVSGVLAMTGPALRLVREGPLASMASAGAVQRVRGVPWWPLLPAVALMIGAVLVMGAFEHGSLPLNVGVYTMSAGLFGLVLVTLCLGPRAALAPIALLTMARPDIGRLLRADVQRYALFFGISAAILVDGAGLAIGSQTMQHLGTAQVAAQKAARLPDALLISAQGVLDQRDGRITDPAFARIVATADGREVSSRWRSRISSGTLSRIVIGVTPGDRYSRALYSPVGEQDSFWNGLRVGEVGLSEVAASRLRATTGDIIELPTVAGLEQFRVAGVFQPRMIDDTAVGDIVLTSEALARSGWAAVRDQVAVSYPTSAAATAHRRAYLDLGAGLSVYDDAQWRVVATAGISRFLAPFTISGYIVMAAAGVSVLNVFVLALVQRKRERAALRAIGVTSGQEQATVLGYAALLTLTVTVLGGIGGAGLAYLWSLGAPVYYGIRVDWGLLASPLRTGFAVVLVLVSLAALYPVIHARRLETVAILRGA